jgi:hypothetical protein
VVLLEVAEFLDLIFFCIKWMSAIIIMTMMTPVMISEDRASQ